MAISFPNHNLEDPFHHSSLLSLLRKTTGDRSTRAINSNQQEPQFLHQFLKPMAQAIRSSENFLEQAKIILDSNSVRQKPDLLIEALSQDEGMDLAVNAADHRQRRRPAMRGRKRCEFSLRSDLSQSSLNADTTSNILQLKDPEEFFLAFERSEKADRFLKKLRGEDATNVTQYRQSEKTRTRRPGISGKKYSYKHPVLPDIAEKCSSSQEEKLDIYGDFVSSQTEISSQEAPDAPGTSQEMAISDSEIRDITQRKDSVSMMENNVGKLLETLMFSCEDLDGGGTVSLLQEQLGVKPIDLPKLSLPNLSVLPSYFSPSQRLSSRPADEIPATALSAFRKLASNSNGKTPAKFQPEPESSSPQTSPTPPNMLASISRLLKHNTKMDMHDSPSLDLPQENKSFVKHSYSGRGTGISSIPSSVDISKHDTRSLNFSQYFTAASVDGISTSNGRSPIKFPKETANSICPPTSTPPRSLEALLPISQKHDAQFNYGSPGKHSPSVVQMGIHGISPLADANKDDTGSLGFSIDPSATNIDGRRLGFDGDAQTLEENNTLVNNSTSPMLLKDHSSCPSDGVAAANLNRSGCDMEFRPDGNDSKADEVELTPCKTTLSQGVVPGFRSPTRKTTHGTHNSLPDQSDPSADSCLLVDGESENLSIPVELNNEEYQAPKVTLKRQNKRNAVKHRKILAAARLSPTADSCLLMDDHAENLSVPAELDKENQAPKITLKGRNKRKGLAGPTPDSSCLPVDGPSENLSNSAELNNEDNRAPKISPKKRNAQKAGKRRESLAGAGTVWKSGVRRSTRIRSRPLEEWRGERFLYARIHDSLATVIGLKYASPVKDGSDRTPVFKVKSFVSKKYADLVNKTALY